MKIDEMIAVMEHYKDGGEVEFREKSKTIWALTTYDISWNFYLNDYRIKEKPKTKTVYEWMFKDSLNQWFVSDNLFTEDEAQKHLGAYAIILKTGRQWEVPND